MSERLGLIEAAAGGRVFALLLYAELAKPAIGEVHLHFATQ